MENLDVVVGVVLLIGIMIASVVLIAVNLELPIVFTINEKTRWLRSKLRRHTKDN